MTLSIGTSFLFGNGDEKKSSHILFNGVLRPGFAFDTALSIKKMDKLMEYKHAVWAVPVTIGVLYWFFKKPKQENGGKNDLGQVEKKEEPKNKKIIELVDEEEKQPDKDGCVGQHVNCKVCVRLGKEAKQQEALREHQQRKESVAYSKHDENRIIYLEAKPMSPLHKQYGDYESFDDNVSPDNHEKKSDVQVIGDNRGTSEKFFDWLLSFVF